MITFSFQASANIRQQLYSNKKRIVQIDKNNRNI